MADNLETRAEIDIDENLLYEIELARSSDRLVLALCAKIRDLNADLEFDDYCAEEFEGING